MPVDNSDPGYAFIGLFFIALVSFMLYDIHSTATEMARHTKQCEIECKPNAVSYFRDDGKCVCDLTKEVKE